MFIHCVLREKKRDFFFLNHEKQEEKKIVINLILSHANRTFLILDLRIEPQTFRHTHPTLGKSVFLM